MSDSGDRKYILPVCIIGGARREQQRRYKIKRVIDEDVEYGRKLFQIRI